MVTYIKDGTEYLDRDERTVYNAIVALNRQHRTTNNSQVASECGLSRAKVAEVTTHLHARGYIRNVSMGAAYHWRVTAKAAPTVIGPYQPHEFVRREGVPESESRGCAECGLDDRNPTHRV